jgi:rhodanese-related sulfurtransferase
MNCLRKHCLAFVLVAMAIGALGLTVAAIAAEEAGSGAKEMEGRAPKMQEGSAPKEMEGSGAKMKELLKHTYAEINTEALAVLMRVKVPMLIFDARTGEYDDGRRIPGAKQLSPEATTKEIAGAIKSKEALVVAYCTNVDCPASRMLYLRLKELGYKNVIEYPYGIEGWVKAGNKFETAEGFVPKEEGSAPKTEGAKGKSEGSETK